MIINMVLVVDEKSGESPGYIIWKPRTSFTAVHHVEIFQRGETFELLMDHQNHQDVSAGDHE